MKFFLSGPMGDTQAVYRAHVSVWPGVTMHMSLSGLVAWVANSLSTKNMSLSGLVGGSEPVYHAHVPGLSLPW